MTLATFTNEANHVKVAVSEQFFGWIFGLGDGVKILGPEQVLEQMKLEVKKANERYW